MRKVFVFVLVLSFSVVANAGAKEARSLSDIEEGDGVFSVFFLQDNMRSGYYSTIRLERSYLKKKKTKTEEYWTTGERVAGGLLFSAAVPAGDYRMIRISGVSGDVTYSLPLSPKLNFKIEAEKYSELETVVLVLTKGQTVLSLRVKGNKAEDVHKRAGEFSKLKKYSKLEQPWLDQDTSQESLLYFLSRRLVKEFNVSPPIESNALLFGTNFGDLVYRTAEGKWGVHQTDIGIPFWSTFAISDTNFIVVDALDRSYLFENFSKLELLDGEQVPDGKVLGIRRVPGKDKVIAVVMKDEEVLISESQAKIPLKWKLVAKIAIKKNWLTGSTHHAFIGDESVYISSPSKALYEYNFESRKWNKTTLPVRANYFRRDKAKGRILVSGTQGISSVQKNYISLDKGVTWEKLNYKNEKKKKVRGTAILASDNNIYLNDGSRKTLYQSKDNGQTWTYFADTLDGRIVSMGERIILFAYYDAEKGASRIFSINPFDEEPKWVFEWGVSFDDLINALAKSNKEKRQ